MSAMSDLDAMIQETAEAAGVEADDLREAVQGLLDAKCDEARGARKVVRPWFPGPFDSA